QLISEVRGWGLINGMELNADVEFTPVDVAKAAMEQGLLLVPAGPKVVRFVPPLIVSAEEVDAAATIVEESIAKLADSSST
ncbi:MAG: aminotransferase class III-fold pyridoxal phosphate-dependent enzyme, partial [Coleofasciculus sp. C2-GNP5-27]